MQGKYLHKYVRPSASIAGRLTCVYAAALATSCKGLTCRPYRGQFAAPCVGLVSLQTANDTARNYKAVHGHASGLYWPIFGPSNYAPCKGRPCGPFVGLTCGPSTSGRLAASSCQVFKGLNLWAVGLTSCASGTCTIQGRESRKMTAYVREAERLWPNDSEISPERLLAWSNDYAPERLGKSTRTIFNFNIMLALAIFYAAMLLPPFVIKWIDKCNSENTDNK